MIVYKINHRLLMCVRDIIPILIGDKILFLRAMTIYIYIYIHTHTYLTKIEILWSIFGLVFHGK